MNSQTLTVHSSDFVNVLLSIGSTILRLLFNIYISTSIIFMGITNKYFICAIVIATVLLDYYDGIFFEKTSLNQIGYWRTNRRILDSIVDRFIVHLGCVSLILVDISFLPFYSVILLREVMISGYCTNRYRDGYIIYPDNIAKIASALIAIIVISFLLFQYYLTWFITFVMFSLSIIAFLSYRKRFLRNYDLQINTIKRDELIEVK